MQSCKSCGAAASVDSFKTIWKCSYCATSNYVEGYLDAYLESIDVTRASGLVKIAMASYEAQDFVSAELQFRTALEEDATNYEAWVYRALALVNTVNLQNLRSIPKQTHRYLQEAKSSAGEYGADLIGAAETEVSERLIKEAIRSAERNLNNALKIEHGLSHEKTYADARAKPKALKALEDLCFALDLECSNVHLMTEVCTLIQTVSDRYSMREHPAYTRAKTYYLKVKDRFPQVTSSLGKGFDTDALTAKASKSACLVPASRLQCPGGQSKLAGMLNGGDQIRTYNPKTGSTEFSEVLLVVRKTAAGTCLVRLGESCFTAASEHSLMSNRGPKKLDSLQVGDMVLCAESPSEVSVWKRVNSIQTFSKPTAVVWYVTDSQGFSITDGLVTAEYSSAARLQHFLLIKLRAWRVLDLWYRCKNYICLDSLGFIFRYNKEKTVAGPLR